MHSIKKANDLLKKLKYILSSEQKKLSYLVIFGGIVAAVLELLGVAVILSVLDLMLNMGALREKWYVKPFDHLLNLDSDSKLTWFICIIVILVYLVKNLYFSLYNWISIKFAYKIRRELSVRVLKAYMSQGYIFFVQNNTSRLLQGIESDVDSVYSILSNLFGLITKTATIICISVYILIESPQMALLIILLALFCFGLIQGIFRKPMQKNGILRRNYLFDKSKISIEAIQGNKEILVMSKQNFFVNIYEKTLEKLYKVCVKVDMGAVLPAFLIEMVCIMGVMIMLGVQMSNSHDSYGLIVQISTIAVGAFRILPALGAINNNINMMTSLAPQLKASYDTLAGVKEIEQEEKKEKSSPYQGIKFQDKIEIRDIAYQYPNTNERVLNHINLSIKKGESVALIGSSGAGKTTLSDVILALLKPAQGQILMDGIDIEELGAAWSEVIGYVPQAIYIVDDTIRMNIAFGEDPKEVDDEKVWQALRIAQLDQFVEMLPKGLETVVGERGIRFSGGQRQRLAIARALYRNPEILVLDEATAALDNETEQEVMKAIENLQGYKTLIIVAHRLTTVRKCDTIYEVRDGNVVKREKSEIFKD